MVRKILMGAVSATFLVALLVDPADGQAALRGSPASVDRIHRQAVNHGLRFFPTANSIRQAHQDGQLVRLSGNADYTLVAVSYPYVLPQTHTFVLRLAAQYRAACGEKLVVTSATRPTSMRLANSVDKSVHPTGMAIDLRRPSNSRCLSWLRSTLVALEASGVIEAVEERNPPHFHVAVFPSQYQQYVQARTGGSRATGTSLASIAVAPAAAARTYQVRSGDSLWTIARRNDTTVDRLRAANNISGSRILAGQTLLIPAR